MALRGYTIRRMRVLLRADGYDLDHVPDAYLINLIRQHRIQLEEARDLLDVDLSLLTGLSNLPERVRRLAEQAEAIEDKASANPKWMTEYRGLLAQIRQEVEPLGITIRINDPWANLLTELAKISGQRPDGSSDSESSTDSASTSLLPSGL